MMTADVDILRNDGQRSRVRPGTGDALSRRAPGPTRGLHPKARR